MMVRIDFLKWNCFIILTFVCAEAIVGFEMTEYIFNEDNRTAEVCLKVFSPSEISLLLLGTVQSSDGSAIGKIISCNNIIIMKHIANDLVRTL